MSWLKNGLLLGAGGIAGLAIAAWLESENDSGSSSYRHEPSTAESIEALMEKIREEAKWAMEECTTDEQREKVYEEVKSSIQKLQAALDRSGEKIITDLKAQTKDNDNDELSGSDPLIKYRSTLEKFLKDLENTKGGNGDSVLE